MISVALDTEALAKEPSIGYDRDDPGIRCATIHHQDNILIHKFNSRPESANKEFPITYPILFLSLFCFEVNKKHIYLSEKTPDETFSIKTQSVSQ